MTRLGLTATVLAAGALLCCSIANASTITVNAGPSSLSFVTITSGPPPSLTYNGSSGPFFAVTGSADATVGTGAFAGTNTFDTDNIDFKTTGAANLVVWITLDTLTAPPGGLVTVHSGLTANDINGSVSSVMLSTFLDPTNGISPPNGSELLATQTFTTPGTFDKNTVASTGPGPFSLQEVYRIVAGSGTGNVNLTIDLTTASPEPATLGLLGTGLLLGIGFLRRRV